MTTTPKPDDTNSFAGTTQHMPGLYPYCPPARPVGHTITAGEPVMFDPLAWAQTVAQASPRAADRDPTRWVRGVPGFGKSVLPRELFARERARRADMPHDLDAVADAGTDVVDGEQGQQ